MFEISCNSAIKIEYMKVLRAGDTLKGNFSCLTEDVG